MSILSDFFSMSMRMLRQRMGMRRELRRAVARFPVLAGLPDAIFESWKQLADPYHEYVSQVSPPVWAVSPQTAALMHALCVLLEPKTALDLGSGFSSFVLRRYSRDSSHPCVVHSVDDDPRWLDQTRNYLAAHGLSTDGIFLWPAFQARAPAHYDLVLHDMGRMNVRLETLPRVLDLPAPDGLLVLDDLHKQEYSPGAFDHCHRAGFEVCMLRSATLDVIGRYAGLVYRPRDD